MSRLEILIVYISQHFVYNFQYSRARSGVAAYPVIVHIHTHRLNAVKVVRRAVTHPGKFRMCLVDLPYTRYTMFRDTLPSISMVHQTIQPHAESPLILVTMIQSADHSVLAWYKFI